MGFDGANWMKSFDDTVWITKLNLPGTHDSCSSGKILDLSSNVFERGFEEDFVTTQSWTIPEQLNAGIRVLDLRVGWWTVNGNNDLYMCHSNYRVSGGLLLSDCLGQIASFLTSHPSETVLVQLAIQGSGKPPAESSTPGAIYRRIMANQNTWDWNTWQNWRLYPTSSSLPSGVTTQTTSDGKFWISNPRSARPPTLGEVRGKAVLLRKFDWDGGFPNTLPGGRDIGSLGDLGIDAQSGLSFDPTNPWISWPYYKDPTATTKEVMFYFTSGGVAESAKADFKDCMDEVWNAFEASMNGVRDSKFPENFTFSSGTATAKDVDSLLEKIRSGVASTNLILKSPGNYAKGTSVGPVGFANVKGINSRLYDYTRVLENPGKKKCGVVWMDFPDSKSGLVGAVANCHAGF